MGPRVGLIQGLCKVTKDPVPCHLCFILSLDPFVVTGWLLAIPSALSFSPKLRERKGQSSICSSPNFQAKSSSSHQLECPELLTVAQRRPA